MASLSVIVRSQLNKKLPVPRSPVHVVQTRLNILKNKDFRQQECSYLENTVYKHNGQVPPCHQLNHTKVIVCFGLPVSVLPRENFKKD